MLQNPLRSAEHISCHSNDSLRYSYVVQVLTWRYISENNVDDNVVWSCVKVEVAVLMVPTVSVDVKQH